MMKMGKCGGVLPSIQTQHDIKKKIFLFHLNWKMGVPDQLIDTPKNTEKAGFPSIHDL